MEFSLDVLRLAIALFLLWGMFMETITSLMARSITRYPVAMAERADVPALQDKEDERLYRDTHLLVSR
jgi:hypothetical protein